MDTPAPTGNTPGDNSLSLRNLDVRIQSGQGSLARILAWMLVVVLLAFVGVSLWFAFRVSQLRARVERYEEDEDAVLSMGRIRPPVPDDPLLKIEEPLVAKAVQYALHLEQAQLALDDGNLPAARAALEQCDESARGWEHGYLLKQTNRCLFDLWQHRKAITCIAADRDGRHCVTGSEDGTVRAWDAGAGKLLLTYREHTGPIRAVALGPHGHVASAAGEEHAEAHVWDLQTGKQIVRLRPERAGLVLSLAFTPDGRGLAVGGSHGTSIWDLEVGQEAVVLAGEAPASRCLAFTPDGKKLLTASGAPALWQWGARSGKLERAFARANHNVRALAISPDGLRLATAGSDRTVQVRELATDSLLLTLEGHGAAVEAVAFSGDGTRVISGGAEGELRAWDSTTGQPVFSDAGHFGAVRGVAGNRDGTRLFSAGADARVKVWDARPGLPHALLPGAPGKRFLALVFEPGGQFAAALTGDGTLRRWDVATGKEMPAMVLKELEGPARQAVLHTPQRRLAVLGPHDVQVFDSGSGKRLQRYRPRGAALADLRPAGRPSCLAFATGGQFVAGGFGNQVSIWGPTTGKDHVRFTLEAGTVEALAFSPDGQELAVSDGRKLSLWNSRTGAAQDGRARKEATEAPAALRRLVYAPGGERLVALVGRRGLRLWPLGETQGDVSLRHSTAELHDVAFTPDGKRVAAACADGRVRLWDTKTGQRVAVVPAGPGGLERLAFSPDGRRLVAAGADGRLRLLDLGEPGPMQGKTESVVSVLAFSPDGKRLVVGCRDGKLKTWEVETGKEGQETATEEGRLVDLRVRADGMLRLAVAEEEGEARSVLVRITDTDQGWNQVELRAFAGPVVFGPDGKQVAGIEAESGKEVRLWETDGGRLLRSLTVAGKGPIEALAFRPDGKHLAVARDGAVRIVAGDGGKEVAAFSHGPGRRVTAVVFSPDGRRVASAAEGQVEVWEAATGKRIHGLSRHATPVRCLAFRPDGKRLASGDEAGQVVLWDLAKGEALIAYRNHDKPIGRLAFSPDGRRLASSGGEGICLRLVPGGP